MHSGRGAPLERHDLWGMVNAEVKQTAKASEGCCILWNASFKHVDALA